MKKGIIVFGMHRSGTSLATKIIAMMGCDTGPEQNMIYPDIYNPKGYWENIDIVKLNDRLLYAIDCSWWKISSIDVFRAAEAEKTSFRQGFSEALSRYNPDKHWVLKDPRLLLTYPLWHNIPENYHIVFVNRHPLEIALSILNRNQMPIYQGLTLWEFYILKYAQILSTIPFTVVQYDDLIHATEDAVSKLYDDLKQNGIEDITMPDESELAAFVDQQLHRHQTRSRQKNMYITPHVNNIYELIKRGDFKKVLEEINPERIKELHEIMMIYESFVSKFNAKNNLNNENA